MTDLRLSERKQRFCLEYVVDNSAPNAAERAGFPRNRGSALLKEPAVQKRIQDEMISLRTRNLATIDRCVEEYAKIAFSDISEAVEWGMEETLYDPEDTSGDKRDDPITLNEDGEMVRVRPFVEFTDVKDLPANIRAAVKSVKMTASGMSIEFYDKKAALDSIMRHLGGFNDTVEVTPGGELKELLQRATNRGHLLPSES